MKSTLNKSQIDTRLAYLDNLATREYNVTQVNDKDYGSLQEARQDVPAEFRKIDMLLSWRNTDGDWETKRFVGDPVSGWELDYMWKNPCTVKVIAKTATIHIDQTISDPASMISGDVRNSCIQWIRDNSHRYVAKYNTNTHEVIICQLDDTDSTKYYDGTDASSDIVPLEGSGSNTGYNIGVFMKMPTFWYKGTEGDQVDISFAIEEPEDANDNWVKWNGNTLIGAYEAFVGYAVSINHPNVFSYSGTASTGNVSQKNFIGNLFNTHNYGFQLVDWQMHCVMAILFYAYYGNTNSQAICGSGTNSYEKETGQTNSLGMKDTDSTNGNSMSINFWGLENWWGNKYEWMDSITTDGSGITISSPDPTGSRNVAFNQYDSNFYPNKLKFGKYCDLAGTATSGSDTTGYCDRQYCSTHSGFIASRSLSENDTRGGIAYIGASTDPAGALTWGGSRLAFRGTVIIESDVQTFKSL